MTNVTVFFQEKKDGALKFSPVQEKTIQLASISNIDNTEMFLDELADQLSTNFSDIHIMTYKLN